MNKILKSFQKPNAYVMWLAFFCLTSSLHPAMGQMLQASLYPQQLSQKISIHMESVTVTDVFQEIENQSNYVFIYSHSSIDKDKIVSVDAENQTIEEILDNVLKPFQLDFSVLGNQVILKRKQSLKKLQHQKPKENSQQIERHQQHLPSVSVLPSFQQKMHEKIITGKVIDAKTNDPLPGVNIIVKGTTLGTVTDVDGNYSISVPNESDILIFSSIGFVLQEVAVNEISVINIALIEDIQSLEEIVVIGYGEQKKATLTGSVASVSGRELQRSAAVNVSNSLAGLLPGIIASNISGEPGNTSTILIRGRNTLGDNSPLILVDGIETPGWERINSNDIESISVLKDASAAIYGARAANGVMLITTKRGKIGKPTFNYTFNQGLSQPTRIPELANSYQFAEYINDIDMQMDLTPTWTEEELQKFKDGSDPVNYPNIDWFGETLKSTVPQSKHNLNIRGGTDKLTYSVSLSYGHEQSIFKGGSHDFKTYTVRSNLDAQVNDYIKIGFDINAGMDNGNGPPLNSANIFRFVPALPYLPVYWQNGLPSPGRVGFNPVVGATDAAGNYNTRVQRVLGRANLDIIIPWVNGLSVKGYFVANNNIIQNKNWDKPWTVYNYEKTTDVYTPRLGLFSPSSPILFQSTNNDRRYLLHLRVSYDRQFKEHTLNAFVAAEQEEGYINYFSARRENFTTPAIDELFAGSLTNQQTNGSASESGRQSLFGRLSYDFKDKYLVDFNFRYDGSSKFPVENRFGFFPGAAVAWRISEENFISGTGFIDELKVRASYGEIGNDQIPPFQYLSSYIFTGGYNFGQPMNPSLGLQAGVSPNPNITWEVAKLSNVGLDASLWNGILGVEVDVFKQKRTNILADRGLAVPSFAAISLPDENFGIVENKGFELQLSTSKVMSGFSYKVATNVAYAKSKVIEIAEPSNIPVWQKTEGHPIGAIKVSRSLGIFRTQEQLDNAPTQLPGTVVGDLIYEDISGDGKIDADDLITMDKSFIPEVTFGLNLSMAYKNFSLWANFAGQARSWVLFYKFARRNGNPLAELLENRWRPGSMDSKYPRLDTFDSGEQKADFWLLNTSFVRLKTLELGYDLPHSLVSKLNIQSLRIYVNGNNLFTIDDLDWYDPEGIQNQGYFYPQNKIYNIGFNLSF